MKKRRVSRLNQQLNKREREAIDATRRQPPTDWSIDRQAYHKLWEFLQSLQNPPHPLPVCLCCNATANSKDMSWTVKLEEQQSPKKMMWSTFRWQQRGILKSVPNTRNNEGRRSKMGLELFHLVLYSTLHTNLEDWICILCYNTFGYHGQSGKKQACFVLCSKMELPERGKWRVPPLSGNSAERFRERSKTLHFV